MMEAGLYKEWSETTGITESQHSKVYQLIADVRHTMIDELSMFDGLGLHSSLSHPTLLYPLASSGVGGHICST